jgi:hypothetical protein
MHDHITHYSVMPIPPTEERTTWFPAGNLRFGVEYRRLTDAVAAAAQLEAAVGDERGQTEALDDRGVSIHVSGQQDGEEREFLRFDCFREDPHYHYISWRDKSNEMLHMDPHAVGDPVEFALECVGHRLTQLLSRAGAADVAATMDADAVKRTLRDVRAEAMRLRAANPEPAGDETGDVR